MATKEFDKYVVFKRDELDYVLDRNPVLKKMFDTVLFLVGAFRISTNKKPENRYIVCNQDEPYASEVWRIILDGEDEKNAPKE